MSPTYLYTCPKCETFQEDFRPISKRDDLTTCPACQGEMHRAVNTEGGFILLGNGWARDRYTGKSNQKWLDDNDD